jgi:hypothetical protein
MGRNRGSVIGNAISPSTSASTGFWTRQEVYFLIKSNSWQLPSNFTLTSNASNVNEGAYITFTLNVNNFIGSGLIPYTVTGVSSDDFAGNLLTGNFVINNGTGNVTFLANLDYVMEGDSMTLSAAGKSVVVIINDVVDTDQYFNYTTLLLSSDTAPTYISDASSNTFEINPLGSVKSDTSQPFQEGYYSGYFNGSASYLTTPDAVFTSLVLDGAFTIEAWINLSALAAVDGSSVRTAAIVAYHNSINSAGGVGVGYNFIIDQTSNTIYFGKNGVGASFTSSYTFLLNTWYHVAIAYTGSVATIYVNGTSLAVTVGVAWTFVGPSGGTVTLRIATFRGFTSYQQDFPGYISNLRIVKGVGVYTGTFTPPTAPLAITQSAGTNISAITGTQTSLLTLQSNRFKDQTAAALALTPAGNPEIKTLQPFTLPTTWATWLHAWQLLSAKSATGSAPHRRQVVRSHLLLHCLLPTPWRIGNKSNRHVHSKQHGNSFVQLMRTLKTTSRGKQNPERTSTRSWATLSKHSALSPSSRFQQCPIRRVRFGVESE